MFRLLFNLTYGHILHFGISRFAVELTIVPEQAEKRIGQSFQFIKILFRISNAGYCLQSHAQLSDSP